MLILFALVCSVALPDGLKGKLEVSLGLLNVLADFLGKRIKIELVGITEE